MEHSFFLLIKVPNRQVAVCVSDFLGDKYPSTRFGYRFHEGNYLVGYWDKETFPYEVQKRVYETASNFVAGMVGGW